MTGAQWWRDVVAYQIYPRSFCDTDGDGVGDLEGIRRHLDHVAWLGAGAIWLSPFYRSPMADFGYDVADYCDVDPLFGTIEDFDRVVQEAHARDLKVLVDWVPNHSSDRHRWFVSSRSSRQDPKRDWYWWRDDRPDSAGGHGPPGSPGRLPNNWQQAFTGVGQSERPPAWTWDPDSGQWYLHMFLPEQPDLNWANPEVRAAMADTLRFWMARGVDGFRVDVVQGIGKDPDLADIPDADQPPSGTNDRPETHEVIRELRKVVDGWPDPPARMMVGEVYLPTTAQVATYYGTDANPELHLSFNFPPLFAPWDAGAWRACIDAVVANLDPIGAWPTWVLSNHDNRRHRTRYGSESRARAAAVVLLTLRGTPFVYAGEELGLEDAVVPLERQVDPGGRDGCRAPLPWDATAAHGWSPGPEPWLPWPPDAGGARNVAAQRDDPASILHLYRRLLAVRRASPALTGGDFEWLETPEGVLGWVRSARPDDRRVVLVDFSGAGGPVPLPPGRWDVEVETSGAGEGHTAEGVIELEPDGAVVLRPK
ncbi:DUF3459 domain-containing protein [Acidiferrimicrobium sp. IK]|uniref:alpha-amylase family glycosyl hydrolase n=1 Tax=Acidiferrimicrobium sp. IK TaxID=2871700 RepID=UPI0021CB32D5|nr:alpha-amylase family glycosyl hydrolase [Acidiferrimicrobium sp. IK]MCU4184634.1 DUF3459 domain-containing protein [Acidiferrimicrobium sp. IK]